MWPEKDKQITMAAAAATTQLSSTNSHSSKKRQKWVIVVVISILLSPLPLNFPLASFPNPQLVWMKRRKKRHLLLLLFSFTSSSFLLCAFSHPDPNDFYTIISIEYTWKIFKSTMLMSKSIRYIASRLDFLIGSRHSVSQFFQLSF